VGVSVISQLIPTTKREALMTARDKINAYLEAGFVHHKSDYEIALLARQLAKWWLDFVRNILVIGGLYYIAEKSGSAVLKIFSYINFGVLIWYITAHFNTWSFRFFPYIKNQRVNNFVNLAIWGALYGAAFGGSMIAFAAIFSALQVLQVH
jgi:hypothetical protein